MPSLLATDYASVQIIRALAKIQRPLQFFGKPKMAKGISCPAAAPVQANNLCKFLEKFYNAKDYG